MYQASGRVEPGLVHLAVRGVARYAVRDGAEITVEPETDARPEDVRLYLLGSMFGALLHQRGVFPLHAAAVEINGSAAAFAGPSGAGKSTLVALLARRGGRLITDDISVIEPLAEGQVGVWPGAAHVKLDTPGLEALRESGSGLGPAGGDRAKYHLPVETGRELGDPVPLRRLYLLEESRGEPVIELLSGMEATHALIDETYFIGLVEGLGLTAQNFRLAASVARSVKVCRLHRPRGFEHLQRVVELVEADVGRKDGGPLQGAGKQSE